MFYLSRLLLGGGALASSGGLSAYFVPKLTSSGENTIYKSNVLDGKKIDYRKLDSFTQEKIKELNEVLKNLQLSKSFANKDKESKHKKSLELMAKIATSEEALQNLYNHIKDKLTSLKQASGRLTENIKNKLEIDSYFKQIKVSQDALNQLVQRLKQWEEQINVVVCAFKQQGQESSSSCNLKSTTLFSLLLKDNSSVGGGVEQSSLKGDRQAQTEGDRAQKTLSQAQQVFKQLQQSIQKANLSVQKESMQMIWEELQRYPEWIKLHSQITLAETHIQLINKTIKTTNNDASQKTQEINQTNEELRSTYDKYNNLKKWESSFHNFIEQFQQKILELKSDNSRQVVNVLEEKS